MYHHHPMTPRMEPKLILPHQGASLSSSFLLFPTPPPTLKDTHLDFRVVRCHTKAHQAKGHELLLVDVYMGPGMVLGENHNWWVLE